MPSVLFFLTITKNLNFHQDVRGDAISFLKEEFSRTFPGIKIIPTTETEIRSITHSLKAENSSSYDLIRSKILKVCASVICQPFTHICNHSLFMGIFPDHCKISVVRPLCEMRIKLVCQTTDQFHYYLLSLKYLRKLCAI
jgi:hypothetical protein